MAARRVGRALDEPIEGWELPGVLTPDDIVDGASPGNDVVVFDDDHYYMASVIAEKLAHDGARVTFVTPANEVATWTNRTDDQFRIQSRLMRLGVAIETGKTVGGFDGDEVRLECAYTSREISLAATPWYSSPHGGRATRCGTRCRTGVRSRGSATASPRERSPRPSTPATAMPANSRATPGRCSSASTRRLTAPTDR